MQAQQPFSVDQDVNRLALANQWIDSAIAEYQCENHLAAKQLVTKAIEILPRDPRAINLLGRLALDNNQISESIRLFDQALALKPNDEESLINLGYAHLSNHDIENGEFCFQQALGLAPESEKVLISLAYTAYLKEDMESALTGYRRLFHQGCRNSHVITAFADCCSHFSANSYLPELEQDLIALFGIADLNTELLAPLALSLLVQKFNLRDENAQIDISELAEDRLLLLVLSNVTVSDADLEALVTAVRSSIFIECMDSNSLPEHYQPMMLALGQHSARNGYLFEVSPLEIDYINLLHRNLDSAFKQAGWEPSDVTGALLLLAMYENLFDQPFSFNIATYDLEHWPQGAQGVLYSAYYAHQSRASIAFDLRDNQSMASPEISQVTAPLWERVIPEQSHNLISAIQNELDNYQVGNHLMDKPLRVLVLGCDAGYNAIRIASHFPETEVTAIDKSLRNITHAIYHANLLGLENISFKTDEADHLRRKGYYDVIDCSNYLNYEEDINACLHHLLAALSKGGLIKLGLNNAGEQEEITQLRAFVDNNDLSDHIDNVRALRHAIIDDAKTGLWQKTVTSPWFYNTFTVINTLFVEQKSYSVEDIKHICQLHDLDFIGYSQTRAGANKSQSSASALDKVSADQHDSIANQLEFYSQKANQNLGEVIFIKPAICL